MKRAYIYARTSTIRQSQEDRHSIESQLNQAKDFLKSFPEFELQDTILDATSAYSGSHLDAGLGSFLREAEQGLHVDSLLVIVYADRLTRLPIDDAFNLLKRLALAKVNLAITSLGSLIRYQDPLEFGLRMTLTALFHIAHTDSKVKSDRIRAAFATRAEKIRNGEKVIKTSGIPPWISVVDGAYVIDEEKAGIINYIFEQKRNGYGGFRIAKALTEMGATPFTSTGKWARSYVDKLLNNPATYGAYQVTKTVSAEGKVTKVNRHAGEPIEGYFPAAITKEVFEAAQYQISITPKGRVSTENPFRGLFKCYCCGKNMSITKSKSLYYLRCNSHKERFNSTCTAKGIRLEVIKERVLLAIAKITLPTLEASKPDVQAIKGEIAKLEKAIARNHQLIDSVDDDALADEAIKKISTFTKEVRELEKKLYRVSNASPDLSTLAVDININPQRFNQAMLEVFESITVDGRFMEFQLRSPYGNDWEPALIDWESVIGIKEDREEGIKDYLEFMQMINNAPRT
ncbi:recombinase family protein [Aeromonas sanarellii]|uniref:recombinase family protein n=1 Tax=Aeromonas sanarellii TaxID=633415 RepID=UPI0038D1C15A